MLNRLEPRQIAAQVLDAHGILKLSSAFPHPEPEEFFSHILLLLTRFSVGEMMELMNVLFSWHRLSHGVHKIAY